MKRNRKSPNYWIIPAVVFILFMADASAWGREKVMTDLAVKDVVADELLIDDLVQSRFINVDVNAGIVTLSGDVGDLASKERAAKIALTVKGVRSVVNQIKVMPKSPVPDKILLKSVKRRLMINPVTEVHEISVSVKDGQVTLSGEVDSFQEKELSSLVIKDLKGVTGVKNAIDVTYKMDRPDAEIETEVESRLFYDVLVDDALIDVEVKGGSVILTGTVGSAAEKFNALLDAHVAGVKSVDVDGLHVERWARDNDLRKKKYAPKTDKEIEKAVRSALAYDPRIMTFQVEPEVLSGIVTLRGEVNHLAAKRAAAQDAKNTVGVVDVKNRIKVRSTKSISDQKIGDDVRWLLSVDPYVDRYNIKVSAREGIVKLYGSVDTYSEKARADKLAADVSGVVAVINHILVEDSKSSFTYSPYEEDVYPIYEWRHTFGSIKYETAENDGKIKSDIEYELWLSPFVNAADIDVDVNDGVAVLNGTVASWPEKQIAAREAYEGGAAWVYNRLRIENVDG